MKNISGAELVGMASTIAITISQCMDTEELEILCEFLGLIKHEIELIKRRRFINTKDCGDQKNRYKKDNK